MTGTYGNLIDWWRRRGRSTPRIRKIRQYEETSALPDKLPRREIAVAGTPPTWAAMECPCGTGHRLMVRIRPHSRVNAWDLDTGGTGPTLHPSIDSVIGQKRCHFWLRDGRVRWVPDEGSTVASGSPLRQRRTKRRDIDHFTTEGR